MKKSDSLCVVADECLKRLDKLRVFQSIVYLVLQYFPFPAFRQGPNAHSLLHFSATSAIFDILGLRIFKPFAHGGVWQLAA